MKILKIADKNLTSLVVVLTSVVFYAFLSLHALPAFAQDSDKEKFLKEIYPMVKEDLRSSAGNSFSDEQAQGKAIESFFKLIAPSEKWESLKWKPLKDQKWQFIGDLVDSLYQVPDTNENEKLFYFYGHYFNPRYLVLTLAKFLIYPDPKLQKKLSQFLQYRQSNLTERFIQSQSRYEAHAAHTDETKNEEALIQYYRSVYENERVKRGKNETEPEYQKRVDAYVIGLVKESHQSFLQDVQVQAGYAMLIRLFGEKPSLQEEYIRFIFNQMVYLQQFQNQPLPKEKAEIEIATWFKRDSKSQSNELNVILKERESSLTQAGEKRQSEWKNSPERAAMKFLLTVLFIYGETLETLTQKMEEQGVNLPNDTELKKDWQEIAQSEENKNKSFTISYDSGDTFFEQYRYPYRYEDLIGEAPLLIQRFMQQLHDKNPEVRKNVVDVLAETVKNRNEEIADKAIRMLISVLKDGDSNVRLSTVVKLFEVLEKSRNEEIREEITRAFISALKDTDFAVQNTVALALNKILKKPLNEKIREEITRAFISALALRDEHFSVRSSAAWTLGDIFEKIQNEEIREEIIRVLISALKGEDSFVRISAAEALVNVNIFEKLQNEEIREEIIRVLISALKGENPYLHISAAEALVNILEKTQNEKIREEIVQALTTIALKDENLWVRIRAVGALGDIFEKTQNEKTREEIIQALIPILKDKDFEARSKVVEALGKIFEKLQNEKTREEIIRALILVLNDKYSENRAKAEVILRDRMGIKGREALERWKEEQKK